MNRQPIKRTGRCVHCSGLREAHAEDGTCPVSGHTKYATMALPEGITCADCHHCQRCVALFGQLPEDEACQFFPIRFHQVAARATA